MHMRREKEEGRKKKEGRKKEEGRTEGRREIKKEEVVITNEIENL